MNRLARAGALLLTFAAAIATSCSRPPPPVPPPPPKVTFAHPQLTTVTNWDEYPGHIEAVETVDLRPRVSGYLDSVHFADGAEVKAGDLLFVVDSKPYQADLDRSAADRRQAETRLDLARNEQQRAEGLRGTKAISEEELDNRSKAVRQAEAGLAAAQAAEASARLNLDYTRITAPITGRIGRRLVTAGNLVQNQGAGGATVLATIVSLDPIYGYIDIEESAFLKYRSQVTASAGAPAPNGSLPCELALVNEEGFPHRGQIDFFDNQVNAQTGTIRLRARFDNPNRVLVPGMFGRLRVMADAPQSLLLVPDVAVTSDLGYKSVYLVTPGNTVTNRSIEAGRAYGPMRAVLKGLAPEDRVVVNGLMTVLMLRPGAQVEPQTVSEAAGGTSPPATPEKRDGVPAKAPAGR